MAKNRPPSQRQLKAGELIRRALADILAREHLRDPDLQGLNMRLFTRPHLAQTMTPTKLSKPCSVAGLSCADVWAVRWK